MEKFGRILLFCINLIINIFLVCVFLFVLIWLISGTPPKKAFQMPLVWIEKAGNLITGHKTALPPKALGKRQFEKAHENLHTQQIHVEEEEIYKDPIKQPYLK